LLTNDGGLARHLELPATGWVRRYRVRAFGRIDQTALDRLKGGIMVEGVQYGSIEASIERQQGSNMWINMALTEGRNREIRRVLEAISLTVNRLIRVSYGPFQLGKMFEGTVDEVPRRVLKEQLGEFLEPETRAAKAQRQENIARSMRIVAGSRRAAGWKRRPTTASARPATASGNRCSISWGTDWTGFPASAYWMALPAPARWGWRRCRAGRPLRCSSIETVRRWRCAGEMPRRWGSPSRPTSASQT